jgi:hypothetical protein
MFLTFSVVDEPQKSKYLFCQFNVFSNQEHNLAYPAAVGVTNYVY